MKFTRVHAAVILVSRVLTQLTARERLTQGLVSKPTIRTDPSMLKLRFMCNRAALSSVFLYFCKIYINIILFSLLQ
jgi:hypothetical protein